MKCACCCSACWRGCSVRCCSRLCRPGSRLHSASCFCWCSAVFGQQRQSGLLWRSCWPFAGPCSVISCCLIGACPRHWIISVFSSVVASTRYPHRRKQAGAFCCAMYAMRVGRLCRTCACTGGVVSRWRRGNTGGLRYVCGGLAVCVIPARSITKPGCMPRALVQSAV